MRKIFNYGIISLMALASVFASCEKPGPDGPEGPDSDGGEVVEGAVLGTVVLGCEEGNSVEKSFTASSSWVVSNTNTWFNVTPNVGQPGDNTLTVSATKSNTDMEERIKSFTIIDGAEKKSIYVVQRGIETTNISEEDVYVMTGVGSISLPVSGTYPFDRISVTSDQNWIELISVNPTSDSTLLVDGVTYSNYMTGEIVLNVKSQNDENASRTAVLSIVAGKQTFSVNVIQQSTKPAVADFTKDFYKSSVLLKFTGTWCTACPNMAEAVHMAQDEMPNRLFLVNAHNGSSNNLDWNGSSKLGTHFSLEGLPSGYFNGYALLENYGAAQAEKNLIGLMEEAIESYATPVNIYATSNIVSGQINLKASVASKVSGNYRISVYILEDGIKAAQADGYGILEDPNNYIHNDILRSSPSSDYDKGGEMVALVENQISDKEWNIKIPSNIVDINNVKILIFVAHDGGPTVQGVPGPGVVYRNYGWVIDNAVMIPVNGFVDFKYEK